MSRARSYKYPDPNSDYVNTLYFDQVHMYLDMGFLRLKLVNSKYLTKMFDIQTLFIDHNCLTTLPDPIYLPNLTSLNCSHNKLEFIPFYPELTIMICCFNRIKNLELYNNSKLKFLDCSHNTDLKLNIYLPNLSSLYVTDCELRELHLDLVPKIKLLDCENNLLIKLDHGSLLTELNICNNQITGLPTFPNLIRLNADYNNLSLIETYVELEYLSVSHNKIRSIMSQPKLIQLHSKNNLISKLGSVPNLKIVDLSYNKLDSVEFGGSNLMAHAHLHFNPLKYVSLNFSNLNELQIDFATYKNIYTNYSTEFKLMEIHCSMEKLSMMLNHMSNIFNPNLIQYIKKKMSIITFETRDVHIYKLSLVLYWKLFSSDSDDHAITSITELKKTKKFIMLLKIITDMYYDAMIITAYFNGYLP